ncbi:hypothetical protein DM01DRAFT_1338347 [Hesseltinella vesiculosa]|uniref:C2H2-type domain-containing protein n=1 Tax=Hesseltinella vesiculosa TaxID=101127 RepID=A0A1X2GAG5_9FUNG|nr:hypothetical protein DM01DRAFT_1338347 [Hesseltinella vesiculosa]
MSGSSYSTSSSSMIVGPSLSPVTSEDSFAQQPYNTPHQLQHQLQYFHSPSMSTCWTGSPALTVSSMPEDPVVIDLVPEAPDRMDDTPNPSSPSNLDHFSAVSSVAVSSQTTAPPPRRPAPPAPANSSDAKSNIQCDVCLKTFTRPYNLNSHKAVHSDEKPYKCSICSTHFKRHHDKTRHEREHKGDYRYNCQYCNKKFTRVDTRNRHFRTYAPCGRRWKLEHPNVSLGQSSRCKARR